MPVRVVNVTTNSTIVPGSNPNGFKDDVSVTNTGTAVAYIDSVQQTATTSGYPLSAGSTVVWQKGRPLWAVAPASTTLTLTENSGALFDAGAVASQILSQGLATQVAQQIALNGAPPIDKLASLWSTTINQDGSSPTSPTLDTSTYGSVQWKCRIADPATLGTPPGTTLLGFYWYDTTGTVLLGVDILNLIGDNNRFTAFEFCYGRVSVKGPRLLVQFVTLNRPGGTVSFNVFGSVKQLRNMSWLNNGYYTTGGGTAVSYGLDRFVSVQSNPALASGASTVEYPPVRSGFCTALFTYNATVPANGLDFLVQDLTAAVPIAGVRAGGAGAASFTLTQQFYMPDRPVSLLLRNKGPAALTTSMQAQFTWEPE